MTTEQKLERALSALRAIKAVSTQDTTRVMASMALREIASSDN